MDKRYCVYKHIRLDTNEVFYIGIGVKRRPYTKSGRSAFWKKVVTKTDYQVEVIIENISWEDACNLEKSLISSYGRKNLNKGTLVNLTDGGEGSVGYIMSEENKLKVGLFHKDRKRTEETRAKMRQPRTKEHISNLAQAKTGKKKKGLLILDTATGIFYYSMVEATEAYSINTYTLHHYLTGYRKNKTNLKLI